MKTASEVIFKHKYFSFEIIGSRLPVIKNKSLLTCTKHVKQKKFISRKINRQVVPYLYLKVMPKILNLGAIACEALILRSHNFHFDMTCPKLGFNYSFFRLDKTKQTKPKVQIGTCKNLSM